CQTPSFRILNGVAVNNDCSFAGISNITIPVAGANTRRVSCNAVLTTATVNGVLKKTFLTAGICKNVIISSQALNL
ncbi:cell wall protein DAN4, partial [Biomphalaria glabrata]